jgi:hypothetical protein
MFINLKKTASNQVVQPQCSASLMATSIEAGFSGNVAGRSLI